MIDGDEWQGGLCYGYLGQGLEGYYITENNSLYRGKLGIEELGNGITYSF